MYFLGLDTETFSPQQKDFESAYSSGLKMVDEATRKLIFPFLGEATKVLASTRFVGQVRFSFPDPFCL